MGRLCFLASMALVPAGAHDLVIQHHLAAPAVVIYAAYAGTEPVPFAKVQVFSPLRATPEFQSGRTDSRGYYSFVPEAPGTWKLVVDDEVGHRVELAIVVPDPFTGTAAAAAPAGASRWERALMGVSLLAGITAVYYAYRVRQTRRGG